MVSRRAFLKQAVGATAMVLTAACGGTAPAAPATAPANTPAAAATSAPAAAAPATKPADPKPAADAKPAAGPARAPSGEIVMLVSSLGTERWMPHLASAADASAMAGVYEFLLYADPQTRQLVPGLAERWEATRQKWTFYLRKGIQFHDGHGEFTAKDVQFTLDLISGPNTVNPLGTYLKQVVERVEAPDPYQIVLYTKSPAFDLGYNFALTANRLHIVSKAYADAKGVDEMGKMPIGTGPYKFVEHRNGNYLKLQAVPNHWRQTPYYQTLTYRIVADPSTALAMLQTGDGDMAELPLELVPQAESVGLGLVSLPDTSTGWVHLGGLVLPDRPGFKPDVPWVLANAPDRALKVRQALNFAVDREQILKKILHGKGKLIGNVPGFLDGQPFTKPDWKPHPYDVEKAKTLLAEAGFPNGFEVEMRLVSGLGGRPEMPDLSSAVADYWEKIGVKSRRVPMDYAAQREAVNARNTAGVAWAYYLSVYDEPVLSMQVVGSSKAGIGALLEDKTVDEQVDRALREMDPQKRADIQKEMGQYLYDGYWAVPLTTKDSVFAVTKKIGKWPMIRGWGWPHYFEYITA